MLPNTLLIGAQKCGSTYLAQLLSQHSDIFIPPGKELHYFSLKPIRNKGIGYYEKRFRKHNNEKIIMEATPRYMVLEKCIKDIHDTLGTDIKLLVILREPIQRLKSNYYMFKNKYKVEGSLDDMTEKYLSLNGPDFFDPVKRGLYLEQLKMIEKYYPVKNIHVITLDSLIENPDDVMKSVADFLEVDSDFHFNFDAPRKKMNEYYINWIGKKYFSIPFYRLVLLRKDKSNVRMLNFTNKFMYSRKKVEEYDFSKENLKKLVELYSEQIEKLEEMYNIDLTPWKKTYEKYNIMTK